jgi:putative ABC transport system substrate-binding protein
MRSICFLKSYKVIIVLSILLCQSVASAAEIIAVQSISIKPYNDALRGFKSACNCNVEQFVVSEMEGEDIVKKIHKAKPEIILAIGFDALKKIKEIKEIPIVYVMILNPQSVISDEDNITGVNLYIDPEKQLYLINQVLTDTRSIGLLYDPAKTGNFVKKAKLAAAAMGIKLIAKENHSSKDFPALLNGMKGKINAFWMLPDLTVVTPETVELLLLFSIENGIPVITFSDKYLKMGALISLNIDANDIGKQAWEITEKVLSGKDIKKIARTGARKADLTINSMTARKMGIIVSDEIFYNARSINGE